MNRPIGSTAAALPLSRRRLLQLGAAGLAGSAISGALADPAWADIRDEFDIPIPEIPTMDAATLDRSEFTRQEQRISRYLVSMAEVANNMEDTDPNTVGWFNRGYSVYQPPRITPFMARLQEVVYILAFFYSYDAPWNPYRLDPVLRDHIYAAMSYYIRIQNPDGSWAANYEGEKNRAVVGFALVYFGASAVMLEEVGWDPAVRSEALASLTKAAEYFTDPTITDIRVEGMKVSNQIIGGLDGIERLLPLLPAHIGPRYQDLLDAAVADAQSPEVGNLYEASGFDPHYSLYTAIPDLAIAYENTDDDRYLQMALKHLEWCQWNFLWEPDGAGFTVNGISTRLTLNSLPAYRANTSSYPDLLNVFKQSPAAQAFNWDAGYLKDLQDQWYAGDVAIPKLAASEVSPANLRLTENPPVYPTLTQRNTAIATFPYFRTDAFVEARTDSRYNQAYVFTNRPTYWFSSLHGSVVATRVYRGPTVFFHQTTGAWIATQAGAPTVDSFWGTKLDDGYVDVNQSMSQTSGSYDQTDPFNYTLTDLANRVQTTIDCRADEVGFTIQTPGETAFTARVPLVIRTGDEVRLITGVGEVDAQLDGSVTTARGVRVRRGDATFELSTSSRDLELSLTRSGITLLPGPDSREITKLDIRCPSDELIYAVRITSGISCLRPPRAHRSTRAQK